jgi:hypothetical protein
MSRTSPNDPSISVSLVSICEWRNLLMDGKSRIMTGWLNIIKSIAAFVGGWGASVLVAWVGLFSLYKWYVSGGLLVYAGRGINNIRQYQIITYETHPLGFLALFAVCVMIAAFGLALCAGQLLAIRRWWLNKPRLDRD